MLEKIISNDANHSKILQKKLAKLERVASLQKTIKSRYTSELQNYREESYNRFVNMYKWPKWAAYLCSVKAKPKRNPFTISNALISWYVAGLPERYIEPISKMKKIDRKTYTNINILIDAIGYSGSVLLAYNTLGEVEWQQPYKFIYDIVGEKIFEPILWANVGIRTIQIPTRFIMNIPYKKRKSKHLPAISGLANPLIVPSILNFPIFAYDYKQGINKRKQENKSWMYTYFAISK